MQRALARHNKKRLCNKFQLNCVWRRIGGGTRTIFPGVSLAGLREIKTKDFSGSCQFASRRSIVTVLRMCSLERGTESFANFFFGLITSRREHLDSQSLMARQYWHLTIAVWRVGKDHVRCYGWWRLNSWTWKSVNTSKFFNINCSVDAKAIFTTRHRKAIA